MSARVRSLLRVVFNGKHLCLSYSPFVRVELGHWSCVLPVLPTHTYTLIICHFIRRRIWPTCSWIYLLFVGRDWCIGGAGCLGHFHHTGHLYIQLLGLVLLLMVHQSWIISEIESKASPSKQINDTRVRLHDRMLPHYLFPELTISSFVTLLSCLGLWESRDSRDLSVYVLIGVNNDNTLVDGCTISYHYLLSLLLELFERHFKCFCHSLNHLLRL